jgi:cell division septation protein DedD
MDSLRHVSPLTPEDVLKVLPGLFWDHDCVMLPGLGGFVCNPRSAWYDEAKRQIVPPSRDVLFNPRLTTNDGVLANELMAKHGVLYPDAIQAVEGLVQHVQGALNSGQPFQLPGLGKLYKEEDGQLRFMADAEFERMLQSFGHASIPLVPRAIAAPIAVPEPVAPLEPVAAPVPVEAQSEAPAPAPTREPRRQPEHEGRVIPLRVKLGRAAAAVAIPLTLAGAYLLAEPTGSATLLGSNPLWNAVPVAATYAPSAPEASLTKWSTEEAMAGESVKDFVARTQWEGRLDYDVVEGRPAAGGLRIDVPVTQPEVTLAPAPEPVIEPVAEVVDVIVEPQPVEAAPVEVVPVEAMVKFQIVGGAFGVKANAEKLAASMRKEGFEPTLHYQSHNGLTAVSMGGYATEYEAREALADARARGHQKAWLKRL